MEVVSVDQTNRKVESSCKNTQRHLRLAISDWYHLLSRLSLDSDTWLYDCHWGMKQVPSQLDMPWAFESLVDAVHRPGMLNILVVKVDEVCISMGRVEHVDFPRSMYELRDSLKILKKELEDAGMAV